VIQPQSLDALCAQFGLVEIDAEADRLSRQPIGKFWVSDGDVACPQLRLIVILNLRLHDDSKQTSKFNRQPSV
jgi:hypothetical protein